MRAAGRGAWPVSDQWDYPALLPILQKHGAASDEPLPVTLDGRAFKLWDVPVLSKAHRGMHLLVIDECGQMESDKLRQAGDVVALFLNIWDKGTYYDGTDALMEAILADDPATMRKLKDAADGDMREMCCGNRAAAQMARSCPAEGF